MRNLFSKRSLVSTFSSATFSFAAALLLAAASAAAQSNRAAPPGNMDPEKFRAAQKEAGDAVTALLKLVEDPHVYSVANKREAALAAAKPLFDKADRAAAEFAKMGTQGNAMVQQIESLTHPIRAALGEPSYTAKLETLAKSADTKQAAGAAAMLAYAKFMAAGGDETAQKKSIDSLTDALKADPASDMIVATLNTCYAAPHAIKEVRKRIEEAVKNDAKSPAAAGLLRQWAAAEKLAALDGKPLTIKSFTLDGKEFSSETLKGKVIMIDFWATWCVPYVNDLPKRVEVYKQYHPKGLEIISISLDQGADEINKFLGQHKQVTWIQLFNPQTPGMLGVEEFGVSSIPRMFLIDKKGIVRTVNGRAQMEKMIPALLAE